MLIDEVTVWSIAHEYFLFKTEGSDVNNDCFHLVNLENGNSTFLIQDFVNDKDCKCLSNLIIDR
jgi:hypothetical protein